MFGGLVHEPALTLARRLAELLPGDLDHVFFSDSGSVAVEVAMKMAVQYWLNRGVRGRTSSSPSAAAITAIPWRDGGLRSRERASTSFPGCLPRMSCWICRTTTRPHRAFVRCLERHADELAGIVVEPLVQGAGGMRFHDPAVLASSARLADRSRPAADLRRDLHRLRANRHNVRLRAAGVAPDIVTLSKALTGGTLPLAATVARRKVFDAFWSDDPDAAP